MPNLSFFRYGMDRKGVSEKMIVSHRLILSLLYMPTEYNILPIKASYSCSHVLFVYFWPGSDRNVYSLRDR